VVKVKMDERIISELKRNRKRMRPIAELGACGCELCHYLCFSRQAVE
jgi:hypothetical protein